MRALFGGGIGIPRSSLPVDGFLRRLIVQFLPPNRIVLQIMDNIGEDGVPAGRGKGIRVGFLIRAGGDTEKSVFRIHRPQAAVLTDADPGDIVAHAPDFPPRLGIALGRDQHGEIGLAAGRREGG